MGTFNLRFFLPVKRGPRWANCNRTLFSRNNQVRKITLTHTPIDPEFLQSGFVSNLFGPGEC